jgi:hypothetical protein
VLAVLIACGLSQAVAAGCDGFESCCGDYRRRPGVPDVDKNDGFAWTMQRLKRPSASDLILAVHANLAKYPYLFKKGTDKSISVQTCLSLETVRTGLYRCQVILWRPETLTGDGRRWYQGKT